MELEQGVAASRWFRLAGEIRVEIVDKFSGGNVHNNFKDNYFVPSLDSLFAVGFVTADGTAFSSGSNVGASSVTIEVINNSETYKKILSALSALTGNTGNSSEDTNGNGAVEV